MKSSVRFHLPAGLVLFMILFVLTIGFVSLFREFLRDSVLIPLLRLIWVTGLVIRSIDQTCIWGVVVFLVALVSIMRLRRHPSEVPDGPVRLSLAPERGRIRFWRNHLRLNAREKVLSRFFNTELRRLIVEVLAFRHHLSPTEVNRMFREQRIEVPPDLWAILETAENSQGAYPVMKNRLHALWQALKKLINSREEDSVDRFEPIARHLEQIMEGTYDTRNR